MLVKSQVKYIQSLGQKKFRDSEGCFVAEGPKIINELLNSPNIQPVGLYGVREWLAQNQSRSFPGEAEGVVEVSQSELERISFQTTPKQVLAIFKKPDPTEFSIEKKISLVLDNIQDPGNLGTLLRTADWFGIENVICSPDCADVFNPKTVQSTMGSIARVQVWYRDLAGLFASYPQLPVYAAMLNGENLYEKNSIREGLVMIGNESKGIGETLLPFIQYRIRIPGAGRAESLNAAVAAGIVLSQLVGRLVNDER